MAGHRRWASTLLTRASLEAVMPKHLMVNVIGFGRKMNPVLERLEAAAMALEEKADATGRAMRSHFQFP
jgi:hypothetical protein